MPHHKELKMSEQKSPNLDRLAAETAQEIVEEGIKALKESRKEAAEAVDNLVTKALGVFQENGVYAGMLFLLSRTSDKEKKVSQAVRRPLLASLRDLPFSFSNLPNSNDAEALLGFYTDSVCNDLDKLFLIKELYEQTLIYARYGAKAAKVEAEGKSEK
jgi:hypothetical protein